MVSKAQPTILAIGNDAILIYLLGRFAERGGYQLMVNAENVSGSEIAVVDPAAIIFLSLERLAKDQTLLAELSNLDKPILVCSSTFEEARAIELGADDCLLHPLTYADFEAALANVTSSKRV